MLIGGRLHELGCGIYPKPPRVDIDLAVLNSPGWLHFGITHLTLHLQCVVPKWEELYIHVNHVTFEAIVKAGNRTLIDDGPLASLQDPDVIAAVENYVMQTDILGFFPA